MNQRRAGWMLLLAALLPPPLYAQLGEVRLGAMGSYGAGAAYRGGAGLTASYAPGRLASVGLRWIHYGGSRDTASDQTGSYDVTNRAQFFGGDLGLEAPLGGMELVAGLTLGAVRFEQSTTAANTPDASPLRAGDTEFVVAPHLMLGIRTGPLMFIPQVSYYFAGPPDLRWPVGHRGIVASLMVVILIETDRFRY